MDELTAFFKKNEKKPPADALSIIMNRIEQQSGKYLKGSKTMEKRSKLVFAFSFIIVAAIIIVITYHFTRSSETAQGIPQKAFITFIMGHAEMETPEGNINKLRVGQEVTNARVIRTRAGSRLDLRLSSGSAFSITEGTELKLSSFLTSQQNNENTNIDLFRGKLLVEPNKIRGDGHFDVNTPTAVAGVRGTRFSIAYNPDMESTRVAVQTGTVAVRRKLSLDINPAAKQKLITVIGSQKNVVRGESVVISRESNEQISETLNRDIDNIQRNIAENQNIENISSVVQARKLAGVRAELLNNSDNALFANSINREEVRTVRMEIHNQNGLLLVNGVESTEPVFSGDFAPGAQVNVKLIKQGYKPFDRNFIIPGDVSVFKPFIELKKPFVSVTVDREIAVSRLAVKYQSGLKPATSILENNNKLYFGAKDGSFYCINMENNGAVDWKIAINAVIESTPVMENGRIYFGARNGIIYVLDAQTGRVLWMNKFGTMLFNSQIVIKSRRVYFGTVEGFVYSVNRETGSVIWNKKLDGGVWGTIAVNNNAVYAGCEDGYVYAMDRNSGKELWKKDLGSRIITPVVAVSSRVIATNYSGKVFGLQNDTGNVVWEREIGSFKTTPVVSGDSVFFTLRGRIIGINAGDGNVLLNKRLYGKVNANISQNRLFITSGKNNISEFSLSGTEIWTYKPDGNVYSKPVSNENYVYTVLTNGTILKLHRIAKKIITVQEQRAQ